ncbi:MAG: hypothetical protein ACM3WV_01285 [Bacillota bacterium]
MESSHSTDYHHRKILCNTRRSVHTGGVTADRRPKKSYGALWETLTHDES